MKRIVYVLLVLLMQVYSVHAEAPLWMVNTAGYPYSHTITGEIDANDFQTGSNDLIGAFINGECRGVVQAELVQATNRYLFFLTVFSDVNSGETISFKYYHSTSDSIYTGFDKLVFTDGANNGAASNPYLFSLSSHESRFILSADSIMENNFRDAFIGRFTIRETATDHPLTFHINPTPDEEYFYMKGDSLMADSVFNYEKKNRFILNLYATDELNDTENFAVTIRILDENEAPYHLTISNDHLQENLPAGSLIGKLEARDDDMNDAVSFSFGNTTSENKRKFEIINDSLYTKVSLDFEEFSGYSLPVIMTDLKGKTATGYIKIYITDVQETSSVFSVKEQMELVYYPNPVQDILNFVENYPINEVEIFDHTGRLISTITGNGIRHLHLEDLKAGVYLIRVTSDKNDFTFKIIKK